MLTTATAILLVLVALAAVIALFRSIFRLWLDYRVRMALLDKIEVDPQAVRNPDDIDGLMSSLNPEAPQGRTPVDHAMTGIFIAAYGVLSILIGRGLRVGPIAVGLDMGGWALLALGLGITAFGTLLYWVYRHRPVR